MTTRVQWVLFWLPRASAGFTFPVLLVGRAYVEEFSGPLSIPSNWIVDADGVVREQSSGFDLTIPNWPGEMLQRLSDQPFSVQPERYFRFSQSLASAELVTRPVAGSYSSRLPARCATRPSSICSIIVPQ